MQWYEAEVRALELARSDQPQPVCPVVFYGSSSIRLWTTLARDMESDRVMNLGFGGSTLEACVYFFERLVVPVAPRSLVLYAGDNDLGDGRSAADVAGSFHRLCGLVAARLGDIPFGVLSIKPSPARAPLIAEMRRANGMLRSEIERLPQGYFIDVFDRMLTGDGSPRAELFQPDGLHMNAAGYALWTECLIPYRNRILTKDC